MAIVTISRELGSQGTSIATTLAEWLDCQLLDKGSVEEKMSEYGVPAAEVELYDEKKPGFWDRIANDKTRYEHFLRGSILESARTGNCVILGRGGQVVLASVPDVIHVRITAPHQLRIERVRQRFECSEEQAARMVRQSDQDRSGFHRFFFGTKWADPQHYDLVIRTAKLSAEQAVQGIVDVTPPRRDGAQQQVLIDRCLEMRVRTLLIYREQLSIMALSVEASEGVVTLRGQMIHEARIDEVSALVSNLEDVRKVDNQLVLNHYPMISDHYF